MRWRLPRLRRAPLQELTPPPALAWPWLETWPEDDWLARALSTMAAVAVALFLLYAGSRTRWRSPVSPRGLLALLATAVRLLVPGGWRRRGVLSSLTFPALIEQLTPASLEAMLRHGAPGLLPVGARVDSVHALQSGGFDGVKGDKHIVAVSYSGAGAAALPPRLFVKLSARGEFAMKMLAAATQTAACEALFYLRLAAEARECGIASPRCYFADFSSAGESCLLLEPLCFGGGGGGGEEGGGEEGGGERVASPPLLPPRHRARDPPSLAEQRAFVQAGGGRAARERASAAPSREPSRNCPAGGRAAQRAAVGPARARLRRHAAQVPTSAMDLSPPPLA